MANSKFGRTREEDDDLEFNRCTGGGVSGKRWTVSIPEVGFYGINGFTAGRRIER